MPLSPSLAVSDWPSSCTKIMDSHSSTTSFFVAQFSNALQRGGVTSANTESRPLQDQGTLAEEVFAAQPALCQPTVQLCMTCSSGLLWLSQGLQERAILQGLGCPVDTGNSSCPEKCCFKSCKWKKKKKKSIIPSLWSTLAYGISSPLLILYSKHHQCL